MEICLKSIFCSQFGLEILVEILDKDRNLGKRSKFLSKIEILNKDRNVLRKIEIF